MKPVNMNDGGRNLSLGGSRGAMGGGVITAPHYDEEIAKFAAQHRIKYRYAYEVIKDSDLTEEQQIQLIKHYQKIG